MSLEEGSGTEESDLELLEKFNSEPERLMHSLFERKNYAQF